MSIQEENFKICGLCSQLVDESVVNNETLRSFLGELLNVSEDSLPTKTCMECYKTANESKRFKDACLKSINKLQNSKVASSMILGSKGVTLNAKPVKPTPPPPKKAAPAATESSKKKKILESLGLDPDQIDIDVTAGRSTRTRGATESSTSNATPPARASRSKGATPAAPATPSRSSRSAGAASTTPAKPASASKPTRGRANSRATQKDSRVQECRIMIKKIERLRADRHFNKHGVVRNSAATAGTRKRGADALSPPPAPAPAKRLRKGYAYEPVVPVAEEPLKSSPGKNRSSFGRVRNSKTRSNDYVYEEAEAAVEATEENSPLSKVSKGRKKATPAKKVVEPEPVEDDTEEVFPTIGPYQCEICQMITDTKVDFVAHIKAKHRDVVDDEVLLSLESDIRKSNKKKKANPAPPPPKKASPKKTPSGPASKKAAAKPTPKARPASKKAAAPAKPKPKPASKKAAAQVAEVNVEINSRDKRTESRKAMMEVELETENEDPLGGLEADDVPNGMSGDEPAVVMENAEEDVDQPQAQQDNELSTPPREDHEDKNEVSPTGEALKKSGADLFDSLFSDTQNGNAEATDVENVPVIVQPIVEAPTLGF